MKKRMRNLFLLVVTAFMITAQSLAQNPILPVGTFIPDPSARVWNDGKLYVYGSRDESTKYYCSYEYYVLSTSDLIQWDIVKNAFASKGENDQVSYNNNLLFAPDCMYKDGKYYLYYCQPGTDTREGVAVGNKPEGPFKNGKRMNIKQHNQIDPAVFIDDDGQAYYIWGQFGLKMAKLMPDMMSLDESTIHEGVINEKEHFFHEGAFLVKREGIYYLVYADMSRSGKPTCIGYATSKSVFGPYKYGGVIIDNDDSDPKVWNNHGSIVEFNKQWYVFYHRSSQGSIKMRRTCIEPIFFNDDGSIDEVEMTSQGVAPPLDAFSDIEAERACLLHGDVQLHPIAENNEELTNISSGDRAAYKYINFGDGEVKTVEMVVRPGKKAGQISMKAENPWGESIATIVIPAAIENEERMTISADIQSISGVKAVWLVFRGGDGAMYSVDKFCFKK